jgi:hypothetical protein
MRQALDRWLNKGNQDLSEWKSICGRLSDNDVDRQSVCLKFAELYEAKKIPESELLASISNITGKTLDQIEEILKSSVVEDKPVLTAEQVAEQLGIKYDGLQDMADGTFAFTFTDNETRGTFMVMKLEDTEIRLNAMRKEFNHA